MALPFFRAADVSVDEALAVATRIIDELRVAALCTGSGDCAALRALRVTTP